MTVRTLLLPMALTLAVACNGEGDFEAPDAANAGCGETPPVIDVLTIEEGDELQGGEGGYPSVRITAEVTDEDFDLHWYTMRVWYDEDQATSEAMTGEYLEIFGSTNSGACDTQAAALRMQIGVTGNPPDDTDFWWTVQVFDDQDIPSEPVTQLFRTPAVQ